MGGSRTSHRPCDTREAPLIELRTLGTLDLKTKESSASLDRLLRQPKRIGLLVYLTLRAPIGSIRRDTLLGLFWPDLPQERARRALSQALYVLRHALGNGVLDTTGDDAVTIDSTQLRCDATDFDAAVTNRDFETALALYRGPFLDGFFLPDAPAFEQWLEEERSRLNAGAAQAARALAERESTNGNPLGAVTWSRRHAQLMPYDERAAVQLIRLLVRAGDRPGAQHAFQVYRDRLRADLDLEPPPEVQQALESEGPPLQMPGSPRIEDAPHPTDVPPDLAPNAVQAPSVPAMRRRRRWMLPAIVVTAAVALVLLSGVLDSNTASETPPDGLPRLLVTELTNHTGDDALAPLARLASDWLGREIARTGRVRVVPSTLALQLMEDTDRNEDTSTLARLSGVGEVTGASLVLGGSLRGTADSAGFEAFLLDPHTREFAFVLDPVPVSTVDPTPALQQLREAVIVALAVRFDARLRQWMTRSSLPPDYASYRRYSMALDRFLEGTWTAQEDATEQFIDAWRADTTFTAPLIWAVFGMLNTNQGDRADSVIHALEPKAATLAEWDHAMLQYLSAYWHGDLGATYRWANAVVALAPNSEWRFLLAGAAGDIGCRDDALSVLEHLDADRGWMKRWAQSYWTVRLDLRHVTGDFEREAIDALAARQRLTDEMFRGQSYRTMASKIRVAAVAGDDGDLARYLGEVRTLGNLGAVVYTKLLIWGPLNLAPDTPEHRVILDSALAYEADQAANWTPCRHAALRFPILYRAGRWEDAARELEAMTRAECADVPEYGQYRALLRAHLGDIAAARSITDSFPVTTHGRPVALWDRDFARARVEAIAGEPARAVAYLRAANRRGLRYNELHYGTARIDFGPMWDYAPLQQLLSEHECPDMRSTTSPLAEARDGSSN